MTEGDGKTTSERFDRWSVDYEGSFLWRHFFDPIHELMVRELALEVGGIRGRSIVDIGCGTGGLLRRLSSAGAGRLAGLDSSTGMLEAARRLSAAICDTEFVQGSADSLPWPPESFDIAVSCIAFHHFPHPAVSMGEVARVLVPGGVLLLSDMQGDGTAGSLALRIGRRVGTDTRYQTRSGFEALLLGAGLLPSRMRRIRRIPPVLLVTARKNVNP